MGALRKHGEISRLPSLSGVRPSSGAAGRNATNRAILIEKVCYLVARCPGWAHSESTGKLGGGLFVRFNKLLGLGNRLVHVLDQLRDINLDFRGFTLQSPDRLGIEIMFKEKDIIVKLGQHWFDAPFRPRRRCVKLLVRCWVSRS